MFFKKISVVHFKNILQAEVELSSKFLCFIGKNGHGKTNMLDAFYYLANGKSFVSSFDKNIISHDQKFCMIGGVVVDHLKGADSAEAHNNVDEKEDKYVFSLHAEKKKEVRKNGVKYKKLSNHIGQIPCVVHSPLDMYIITAGSEIRRKLLDSTFSVWDPEYLHALILYNKTILQRNAYLKKMMGTALDATLLEVWDDQLIQSGQIIYEARKKYTDEFNHVLKQKYEVISKGAEEAEVKYQTELHESTMGEVLSQNRKTDALRGTTTGGVHKDDFEFLLNSKPVKKFASQGQQKSFMLSVRLSQVEVLFQNTSKQVVFLVDDLFDKLDMDRVGALLKELQNDSAISQVLLSHTEKQPLSHIFNEMNQDFCSFTMKNGEIYNS